MSDRYIELCHNAKNALYELLSATEPDMGYKLRTAYSDLKAYIAEHDEEAAPNAKPEPERWGDLPIPRREAHVLEHFGEARLTIAELTTTLKKALHVDYSVYENCVRNIVNRLYKQGKLHREGEPWASRIRYRYYVPRKLEGPIADLQAQLDNQANGNDEEQD